MEQQELNKKLYNALFDKDFDLAEQYLEQGADIEYSNINGNSLFMIFVLKKHYSTALWLKNKGADINAVNKDGNTVLHNFIIGDDFQMVDWLFENCPEINPNIENNAGMTPLIASLSFYKNNMFESVIRFNPDINYINKHNNTALMAACNRKDCDDAACSLIDMGADCTLVNDKNNTMAHMAVHNHVNQALRKIVDKYPDMIHSKNIHNETPMAVSCHSQNIEAMYYLYKKGSDINIPSKPRINAGMYPLQFLLSTIPILENNMKVAVQSGDMNKSQEMALLLDMSNKMKDSMLKDKNLYLAMEDSAGKPLLSYALKGASSEEVCDLIDKGMPVDKTDEDGVHLAYSVCQSGDIDIVKKVYDLIDSDIWTTIKRVPIDKAGNKMRISPVNVLTASQHLEALQFLSDKGVSLKGNLQFVDVELKAEEMTKIINNAQTKEDLEKSTNDLRAVKKENVDNLINLLVKAGDDVDWIDNKGNSLLMLKAMQGQAKTMEILIEHGADLKMLNKDDRDILLESVVSYYPEEAFKIILNSYEEKFGIPDSFIIDCILESPEDARRSKFLDRFEALLCEDNINKPDEDGNTPLLIAAATEQYEIVHRLFLSEKCDPNIINNANETALLHAANQENYGMVKEIVENGGDKNIIFSGEQTIEDIIKENCSSMMLEAIEKGEDARKEKEAELQNKNSSGNKKNKP